MVVQELHSYIFILSWASSKQPLLVLTSCHQWMLSVLIKVKIFPTYIYFFILFLAPPPSLQPGCPCTCSPCQTQLLLQTTWRAYKPHC